MKTGFSVLLMILSLWVSAGPGRMRTSAEENKMPKLIVGIIVDQMRYDYLSRYFSKYSENGFKKLMTQGFNCKNTNYNYSPTYTGPGHASVYTGTTPAFHGIIGNDWYVRDSSKTTYVTEDHSVTTVGSPSLTAGRMSPRSMLSSTIGDEIRLYTNMKSKVIAISLKDRSAILPGGHLSNGSFWFDSESGNFITSSYYMKELPLWVKEFNARRLPDKYLSESWTTLLPIDQYSESSADDSPFEGLYRGETKPVFPHNLPSMFTKTDYEVLRYTPFGNSIVKEMTLAALKAENLGNSGNTDVLAISFSATDYIGHKMGPHSIELEDTYLRLDSDIAEIISYLEKNYGKDNFLMFLTADHAAAYPPSELLSYKMNAGYFSSRSLADSIKHDLMHLYNDSNLFSCIINNEVYLNHKLIVRKKLSLNNIQAEIISRILSFKGVSNAFTSYQLNGEELKNKAGALIQNGFYLQRSGDIAFLLEPAWLDDYSKTGTSHGSPYTYDTHVPLLWYGWQIKTGFTSEQIDITDIAPTISSLLNIMAPSACTGKPIQAICK